MNIFEKEYQQQEIDFYLGKMNGKTYNKNGIELYVKEGKKIMRLDGSLYKGFNIDELEEFPTLKIDQEIWMSLTPMEIETHYVPIQKAKGRVGVAGLGAGYYALRIAEKEEVEEVVVYEINERVIEFFNDMFGEQPKIKIIKQDFREIKNEQYDFFYNDIYLTMLEEKAIEDTAHFLNDNNVQDYHFWTMDVMIFQMIDNGVYFDEFPLEIGEYLDFAEMFQQSSKYPFQREYLYGRDFEDEFSDVGLYWFYN